MITFWPVTPRPTARVIFRRKFTAVHHYLLHSHPLPPCSCLCSQRTRARGSKEERRTRKVVVCISSFPPLSPVSLFPRASLHLPSLFPPPRRCHPTPARLPAPLSPSLFFAKNERTSLARAPYRFAFRHPLAHPPPLPQPPPYRSVDVAKANGVGERRGGWLVVGVGCRGVVVDLHPFFTPASLEPPSVRQTRSRAAPRRVQQGRVSRGRIVYSR